jgi:hypothetical protein
MLARKTHTISILFVLTIIAAHTAGISAQTGMKVSVRDSPSAILYDRSNITTGTGNGANGANTSSIAIGSSNFGFGENGTTSPQVFLADRFVLPSASVITSIKFDAYSTSANYSNPPASPFRGARVDIWNAQPGTPGAVILATSTSLLSSTWTGVYRVGSATLTNNQRPVFALTMVFPNLPLGVGSYWASRTVTSIAAPGVSTLSFSPPVMNADGTLPAGVSVQRSADDGAGWIAAVDGMSLIQVDTPLTVIGTIAPPAETLIATNGTSITRFQSDSIGTVSTIPITGLQAGVTLVDIDLRPRNGVVYGMGTFGHFYSINPVTGVATEIGGGGLPLSGTAIGIDFIPVDFIPSIGDLLRTVSNTEQNQTISTNGQLSGTHEALNPAGNIVSIAYDRSDNYFATPTTLYGIDSAAGTLVLIGSINGTPNHPNTGIVTTVGSLGLGTNLNEAIGFDISGTTGTAYASITTGGISRLYTIDLTTGAATLSSSNGGAIGAGTTPFVGLTSLSVPLASGVEVSGRVLTSEGRGVRGATVTMSDPSGATRTVGTGPNGVYRFEDVEGGRSYTMSVTSRRFAYSPVVIQVVDNIRDLDFVPGDGRGKEPVVDNRNGRSAISSN